MNMVCPNRGTCPGAAHCQESIFHQINERCQRYGNDCPSCIPEGEYFAANPQLTTPDLLGALRDYTLSMAQYFEKGAAA